jgi:trans-aconitate methyltransferase
LRAGFTVFAVDSSVDAIRLTLLAAGPDAVRLTATVEGFATYAIPPADLVYAGFSLPFCRRADFPKVWSRVRAALRPGGVVAVTLFGERDSWASEWYMTFVSAQRVDELAAGLDADIIEEERDGEAYSGPKHWHVFDVVARRLVVPENT